MKKKLLCLLLAGMMVFTSMESSVFASDNIRDMEVVQELMRSEEQEDLSDARKEELKAVTEMNMTSLSDEAGMGDNTNTQSMDIMENSTTDIAGGRIENEKGGITG